MWRLDTDTGSYAIKQLSKDIDLQDDQVIKNYELSERIASRFMAQDIPGVCALSQSDKHLLIIDECGYLVYPWVNAKALGKDEINEDQALIIARLLAKMQLPLKQRFMGLWEIGLIGCFTILIGLSIKQILNKKILE
jgi:hypothetical protein